MSNCHEHKDHGGHADAMSHGSAQEFLHRFWIVTFLLIPLVLSQEKIAGFLNIDVFGLSRLVQFGIATVIFYFSLVFFKHAWHEIKSKKYGMMTLVSLAVGAGYLFSVSSTFIASLNVDFYLEISTLIWVLLFGHYLEARSTSSAGNALKEVAKLLPNKAHLIEDDKESDVDVSSLNKGDVVVVKPGEKVPADGEVIEGIARVDESLVTGESKPVSKSEGQSVIAGSICIDGSLTIKLTRVGMNSTVGQIHKLIVEAQKSKPKTQLLADRAAGILTFTAGIIAIITVLVWALILGYPFALAITLGITVLVIACPHALGLAIPTVTTIATSLALKNGIFIKDLAKLEAVKDIDYVVFDKTGTLTKGEFAVTDVMPMEGVEEKDVVEIATSLERYSSHIIAKAISKYEQERKIKTQSVSNFREDAGMGVSGNIKRKTYFLGNKLFIDSKQILIDSHALKIQNTLAGRGRTVVFIADEVSILGVIGLADAIRTESLHAVAELHRLGIKVAMLTGDNEAVAKTVADELSIDSYYAEVIPGDKFRYIKRLQEDGQKVIMVGDGVNDAPALTQANVGIAVGAGVDVAVEAGDIVLVENNPLDVVKLIILSKKVYRKMIQNLVWALGYNIIAIPAAAGVFAGFGFFLRPEIGAFVMSLSTVIVVANAMMLKRVNLESV